MDQKLIQRLVLVGLGAAVIHLIIAISFLWVKNHGQENQEQTIAALQEQWKEEDNQRQAEQEQQLVAKYGTTKLDRIAFDPRMDIKLVLTKLFQAVMPSEYMTKVDVDRFTEFKIFVNVYNMPETNVLAGYLQEVFSRVEPRYVHQIIFTDEERFWIVDQTQLRFVPDWKNTSIEEIKKYCFPASPF